MNITRYFLIFIFVFQLNAQKADFGNIIFKKADDIALKYKNESLSNLPLLSYKLTSELPTDVERFRAIFKWVCSNVANDYGMFRQHMRKRQRFINDSVKLANWNKKFKKRAFEKLLKKNKTVCTGYAYLVKELANLAGIECEIINGYARTSTLDIRAITSPNHSWNAVKLKGKWYLCDPTWASGVPHPKSNIFQFKYNDGFFLSDPEIFSINHYPPDKKWFLLHKKLPTFEMFLTAPIIYGSAYTYFSNHIEPKELKNNTQQYQKVLFKFQLLKPVKKEDIYLIIEKNENEKKVQPVSVFVENQTLIIKHAFKYRGYYDVHLYIEDHLISSYSFKVVK